jgi:hypothetical protein
MPFENAKVYGNAVTIISNVFPDDAAVSKVTFQYRSPGGSWNTIGDGTPITSYMISWNTTSLSGQYELRAVVNNDYTDSSGNYKVTTIEVDSADPDIEENVNGNIHTKEVNVFSNMDNEITLPDGTHLDIPEGAISADADVKIEQTLDAGIGEIMLNITGIDQFLKDITISIAYPDADNNGIVDGTSIDETTLYVQWYNESTGQWERAYDSVVYPVENFVSARTNHLSGWGLGALIAGGAAAGAGGGSASSGTTASYCFIATASYGTPMADDVIILREFRDKYLMRNNIGREFVWHYYRLSPPVADFIKDKPILKMIVRFLLKPIVKIAKIMAG